MNGIGGLFLLLPLGPRVRFLGDRFVWVILSAVLVFRNRANLGALGYCEKKHLAGMNGIGGLLLLLPLGPPVRFVGIGFVCAILPVVVFLRYRAKIFSFEFRPPLPCGYKDLPMAEVPRIPGVEFLATMLAGIV